PKVEIEQLGYKLNYSISPRIPFLKGVDLLIANS
ncbi:Holliday junction resolvase RecU, partial [Lactobacillus salivarius]|nr:Holliday junction resolvase RecU [Ligilactobacillus salivarius]